MTWGRPVQFGFFGHPIAVLFDRDLKRSWKLLAEILGQSSGLRSLVGAAVRAIGHLRIEPLFVSPLSVFISRQFEETFESWSTDLGQTIFGDNCLPVILLPPQGLQRGRLYIYHVGVSDRIEGFSKLSLDDDNDARIARERDLLNELSAISNPRLETPKVLDGSSIDGHLALTVSPLPKERIPCANIFELEEAFLLFRGVTQTTTVHVLLASDWCAALELELAEVGDAFFGELRSQSDAEVQYCRAHGDPGPHNFSMVGDTFWVVDWEDSEEQAPILADKFSFLLGTDRKRILKDPGGYLKDFWNSHGAGDGKDEAKLDVMMAIAFRASRGHPEAMALIRNWPNRQ